MSKSRFYLMMALIGGVFAGKLLSGSGDWEWNVPELLSVVFFGLWLLGSTVMLIIVILTKTKTMTINQDGVTVNRPIDTKSLRWNQILDYGVDFSESRREQSGGGSACGLTRRTAPFCKVEAQFSGIWIRFWGSDPNRPFRASSIF